MNLILERTQQVQYFTYIPSVIEAMGIKCSDYDWYISDVETNVNCPALENANSGLWLTGNELEEILENNQIQFIWGVFSAVPRGYRVNVSAPPYVDVNPNYWNNSNPKPQLLGAEFEIACWDSSATILIGISDSQAKSFCSRFSDTKNLQDAQDHL
jgi:hypothetical protein